MIFGCTAEKETDEAEPANTDVSDEESDTDKTGIYEGWTTYANDLYKYQFKYPSNATVEEAKKDMFGLSQEDADAGLSFDDVFEKYTGKICLNISYSKLGYITISAPENKEFAHVTCGRTGIGSCETANKTEQVTVDGKTYTANGMEQKCGGDLLIMHNETFVVTLDDGTRIEYGSTADPDFTYQDYLNAKKDMLGIIESYEKI